MPYIALIHILTLYSVTILNVLAMGPRPVFDFPDEVVIPRTPLKIENQIFLPVHNIGMVPAGFSLNARW